MTDIERFHKDWKEGKSIVVVIDRPDGTIAKHIFNCNELEACHLALGAFQSDLAGLFEKKWMSSTEWDGKIFSEEINLSND